MKGHARNEYIRQLPPHWRTVYTCLKLQREVYNGGYHQFFWNTKGKLNEETLADLTLVSAVPFVLLFQEAVDQFQRHDYGEERSEAGNSWEAFTKGYKEKRMDDLDVAFCSVTKTIAMHLSEYIRRNRDKYLTDSRGRSGSGLPRPDASDN